MQNDPNNFAQTEPNDLDAAIERVKQLVTTSEGDQLAAGSKMRDFMQWLGTTFPGAFSQEGKPAEMMAMPEYRKFRQP